MATDDIDDKQKIERYILNRMDEEEALEFETYYLSNQECLDHLQMAERFYFGLQTVIESGESINSDSKVQSEMSIKNPWWMIKIPVWATAALMLIALLPSGVLYQQVQHQGLPQPGLTVVSLSLSSTRSAIEDETFVNLVEGRKILSIFIDTDLDGMLFPSYGFKIRKQIDSTSGWEIRNLQLTADNFLYIDLGTKYLQQGNYKYEILGIDENNNTQIVGLGNLKIKK